MSTSDAQKSEVHGTTADASTSPTGGGDQQTTRQAGIDPTKRESPKLQPDPLDEHTRIVKDETDQGGPIVIESDDPSLPHPGQDAETDER